MELHANEFDITRRPMKGWVLVDPKGIEEDDQLKAGFNGQRSSLKSCRGSKLRVPCTNHATAYR
jgi:hypothetical protein